MHAALIWINFCNKKSYHIYFFVVCSYSVFVFGKPINCCPCAWRRQHPDTISWREKQQFERRDRIPKTLWWSLRCRPSRGTHSPRLLELSAGAEARARPYPHSTGTRGKSLAGRHSQVESIARRSLSPGPPPGVACVTGTRNSSRVKGTWGPELKLTLP